MIDADYLIEFFRLSAMRLDEERDYLCALDGEVGDGDHGTSMANGFGAVAADLKEKRSEALSASEVLRAASSGFLAEVGATVGPLYATAFLDAAQCLEGRQLSRKEIGTLLQSFGTGIARRGGAELGNKTMLDVWQPAAQSAQSAHDKGEDARAIAEAAHLAAKTAAQGTASMIAKRGRAARLHERSLGKVDPGATSAAMLIGVFVQLAQQDR